MAQGQFAQAMGIVQALVSRAEAGKRTPSVELLVKLGNLAAAQHRYDDAVWFWGHAGIAVEGLMPATLGMLERFGSAIPKGRVTSVAPGKLWPNTGERILLETRLLRQPYAAKYILVDNEVILVLDDEEKSLWNLLGSHVALLHGPVESEILEASTQQLNDAELSRYPVFARQDVARTSLHSGLLNAVRRGNDTVVTIEPQPYIGSEMYAGVPHYPQVVAVELGPTGGSRTARRVEVPYFYLLGKVIQWIDVRGTPLVQKEAEQRKAKQAAKRKQKKGRK